MKPFIFLLFMLLALFPGIVSCSTEIPELPPQAEQPTGTDAPETPDQSVPDPNDHAMNNSYTRIGHIDNPSGLATALGSGKVTATFEPEGHNDRYSFTGRLIPMVTGSKGDQMLLPV